MKAIAATIAILVAAPQALADATDDCFFRIKGTLNANTTLVASRTLCFQDAVNMTSEAYFSAKPPVDDKVIATVAAHPKCIKWFDELSVAYKAIEPPCTVQNPSNKYRYAVTGSSREFGLTLTEYLQNMRRTSSSPSEAADVARACWLLVVVWAAVAVGG